jgi:hypothetical protein
MLCCQPDNAPLVSSFQTAHQDYGLSILKSNVKKTLQWRLQFTSQEIQKACPLTNSTVKPQILISGSRATRPFTRMLMNLLEVQTNFPTLLALVFSSMKGRMSLYLVDPPETVTLGALFSTIVTESMNQIKIFVKKANIFSCFCECSGNTSEFYNQFRKTAKR